MDRDIFDKIMGLPILNIFEPFYHKYKQPLLYLLFGGLTFLVNVISFAIMTVPFAINELMANIIAWVLAVTFAFFTNRVWVFPSPTNGWVEFFHQMLQFYMGRVATLVVEELILFIFVTRLQFDSMLIKVVAQIIVIILNFVISKLIVFKKKEA